MKYKLMVSEDAGITYNLHLESDSIERLTEEANSLFMVRWVIEDKKGQDVGIRCPIHQGTLDVLGGKHSSVFTDNKNDGSRERESFQNIRNNLIKDENSEEAEESFKEE